MTPPATGELTLPDLVDALPGLLADDYDGARNGRIRDLPDARTVRWYQTLGMVDRPAAFRGRTALYGRHHLLQLAAIKKLQSSGFTLADIQRGIAGKTDAELARTAGLTCADADRVVEQVTLARSQIVATVLATAVAGEPSHANRRESAFWKAVPTAPVSPTDVPSTERGMQSASLENVGVLLWNGRALTPAERAMLGRLSEPLVSFLKSVQSSTAGIQAEDAPRAASPPRRPAQGARP